jgi:hypothetical protein
MKTIFSVIAIVVLACGVAAADNVLINYPDFSSTTGLSLQGAASKAGNVLRVSGTSGANGDAGSAWYTTQQPVAGGFSTTFHFQITNLQGINDDDGNNGGDGFAFVVQNSSGTALGGFGGGIGYDGMVNSLAVEFDTFRNAGFGDPNGNHISIHTGGTAANSDNENHSLGIAASLPNMSDGNIHTAGILYLPGTMTVSLDGSNVLTVPLDLSTKLNLNAGNAWVGFTAAFLAASENHDILNWSVSAVPEPSSLMLAAVGVLSLVACKYRRRGAIASGGAAGLIGMGRKTRAAGRSGSAKARSPRLFLGIIALACCAWLANSNSAPAGVVTIGSLDMFPKPAVTDGVQGIAFDGSPNPLVLDRWSWAINRASLTDASTLETHQTSPVPSTYNNQLVYDSASGDFFTVSSNQQLTRISGSTYSISNVGSGIGQFFNFVSMAEDPSGNLWLTNDNDGGELWRVDKTTGVGSLQTVIAPVLNGQVTALLIDDAGRFIVYTHVPNVPGRFDLIDPSTGARTFLSSGVTSDTYLAAMDYDPTSHQYYGIVGQNTLVRLTGVPEPSGVALAGIGVGGLFAWARVRSTPRRKNQQSSARTSI